MECLAHYPNMGMQPSLSEQPSFVGSVILNFDGSSKGNPGPAGYGCLIRDREGNVMISMVGLLGECDSIKVELYGLLMGLRECKRMWLKSFVVLWDSKAVIGWGRGKGDGSWRYAHYIYEIKELVAKLGVTLYHVSKNHNVMADSLTNWGGGFDL